jgi:ribose/xylose/arabinose/galactoside ABC-type transport system permease subunit
VYRKILTDSRTILIGLLLVTVVVTSMLSPYFLDLDNLLQMTQFGTILGLLAIGQALVIMAGNGGLDLSSGSIMSLAGVVMGLFTANAGLDPWLAALIALVAGALLGAVNGVLVALIGLPALIATLSTLFMYGSLAMVLTGGSQLGGFDRSGFAALGQGTILGFPTHVLVILVPVFVVVALLVNFTSFGRHLYQIGTNDIAARLAGVNVRAFRFRLYCLSGVFAALAAIASNAWLLTARPSAGAGLELQAITIAVLGGVYIFGGRGTVGGVALSVSLVVVLQSGLQLANVGNSFQGGFLGVLLIAAALLGSISYTSRRRKRSDVTTQHDRPHQLARSS